MCVYLRLFWSVVVACALLGAVSSAAGAVDPLKSGKTHWQITDLGDLGGGSSQAVAINNRGQVAGNSYGKAGSWHAFVWQNGKMTDLGTLGGDRSYAEAINEAGQIVGWSTTAGGEGHAFLWERGKMTDLGVLPGGNGSTAVVINQSGDIAGVSGTDGLDHVVLWQNGTMSDLGTPHGETGPESGPGVRAINDSRQIIGWAYARNQTDNGTEETTYGFVWENGTMSILDPLGRQGHPEDNNNVGQVVGDWELSYGSAEHAFLWQNGKMTNLGTLRGYRARSDAVAVNNRGQVIGVSFSANWGHGFLWQKGKMTDLGTLGGDQVYPVAINDAGQVVGSSTTKSGADAPRRAFVWQTGKMTILPTLNAAYAYGNDAVSINGRGQIVGTISANPDSSRGDRAVLWTLKTGS